VGQDGSFHLYLLSLRALSVRRAPPVVDPESTLPLPQRHLPSQSNPAVEGGIHGVRRRRRIRLLRVWIRSTLLVLVGGGRGRIRRRLRRRWDFRRRLLGIMQSWVGLGCQADRAGWSARPVIAVLGVGVPIRGRRVWCRVGLRMPSICLRGRC
jgi:hypothetical protein